MPVAGDESFTYVDVPTLQADGVTDLLVYCGPALPKPEYIAAVRAAGITITFIDEGATDPYTSGYAGGVTRVQNAERVCGAVGYPPECWIVYVLSDQDSATPGPNDGRVIDHAHGIDDTTTRPGWTAYSNRNGCDAARGVAKKLRATWVPATWGANATDALVQQIGSPTPGLDIDTIQLPHWGQWGSTGDFFTMGQMEDIAAWENDTRTQIQAHIDKQIDALKQGTSAGLLQIRDELLAAIQKIPAGGAGPAHLTGTVDLKSV